MKNDVCIFNGQMTFLSGLKTDFLNRSFRYGDGAFETMFATTQRVCAFDAHYARLIKAMNVLNINFPKGSKTSKESILGQINDLFRKTIKNGGAKIRLTVWRSGGGTYFSESDFADYLIECVPINRIKYQTQYTEGMLLGEFSDINKNFSVLSPYKTASAALNVLAGNFCKKNNYIDCIIFNSRHEIVETIASNIFLFIDNQLFTPPISSGCVNGILRNQIIEIAQENNYQLSDNQALTTEHILAAQEVFTTNALSGIRRIPGFRNRRYTGKMPEILTGLLNTKFGL